MKTNIIVLNSIKFRDNAHIINGYSDTNGRSGFVLYGSGNAGKRGSFSQIHPLSIIEAVTDPSAKGSLPVIREFSPLMNLPAIRSNIVKNSIAVFIGELIYRSQREGGADPGLYTFFVKTVLDLESERDNIADFHPCFVVEYCRRLGYLPQKSIGSEGMRFDISAASFTSSKTLRDNLLFTTDSSSILQNILSEEPSVYKRLGISGKSRYEFVVEMLKYLGYHQGVEIELRSLRVLHEVFE